MFDNPDTKYYIRISSRDDFESTLQIDLHLRNQGGAFRALPVALESIDDHVGPFSYHPPAILVPRELGQTMIQQLWDMGFRPKQAESDEGQRVAMANHLTDLRHFSMRLLDVAITTLQKLTETKP